MKEDTLNRFLDFCKSQHFDITAPSSKQREAVLSDTKFVIPAGAGSGKTTVLTYRFLRLIMDREKSVIHSDEILTMTFTKAATANMKSRIYRTLKKASAWGLIEEEEIDRFSKAEISTTDSFCSKIARMDSARYGITPDFRIEGDEDGENWVKAETRRIILESIDDGDVSFLVSFHGVDSLTNAFLSVYRNFADISKKEMDYQEMASVLENNFERQNELLLNKSLTRLTNSVSTFFNEFSSYSAAEEDTIILRGIWEKYEENRTLPSSIKFSRKFSLEKGNKALNDQYKEQKKRIKEEIEDSWEKMEFQEKINNHLRGWALILSSFIKSLMKHKREDGVLTFHDVLLLSIDILRTNSEIRHFFNNKYKKIMVDEFQDNNEENKNLIYLLAAKESYKGETFPSFSDISMEKIFMVGDEKQSIYRFRGADVSVFKNISSDFGLDRVLSLSENFRSEKALIDPINRIFENSIMPLAPEESYEAKYSPLTANNKRIRESQLRFLWMDWKTERKDRNKKITADQHLSEAYRVAAFIIEEIMGHPERWQIPLGKSGETRNPSFSDIAILLRKGTNQSAFEKALRLFDIPFNVSENKSLTMDAVLNDFYNVMQLIVYGYDDSLTFASFLRSPFSSLSEEGISTVLNNLRNDASLFLNLSEEDIRCLQDGLEVISKGKEIAAKGKITSLLSFLWIDCGYRYFIEDTEDNRSYSEHYDYLFSLAASYDREERSLVELLDRIRPMLGDVSKLSDLTVQAEEKSGVTIQTIHKSKGLEYPIVFVSDTGGRENVSQSIRVIPDSDGLPTIPFLYSEREEKLINPWAVYRKDDEKRLNNAETKRLLYVAATRAENHLVFTGCIDNEGKEEYDNNSARNLLYFILKGLKFDIEAKECKVLIINDTPDSMTSFISEEFKPVPIAAFNKNKKRKKTENSALALWYETPSPKEERKEEEKLGVTTFIEKDNFISSVLKNDLYIEKNSNESGTILPRLTIDQWLIEIDENKVKGETEEERKNQCKEERGKRIAEFGTLTHKILEDSINGIEDDYSSFFKGEKGREKAIEEAIRLKDSFFSSSFFRETLAGFELYPERSFMIKDGDTVVEGIIDLLCMKGDEIIIVDYKTDSLRLESSHKNQLNYYVNAISTIYPEKKIRAYVFYLRDPKNVLGI